MSSSRRQAVKVVGVTSVLRVVGVTSVLRVVGVISVLGVVCVMTPDEKDEKIILSNDPVEGFYRSVVS